MIARIYNTSYQHGGGITVTINQPIWEMENFKENDQIMLNQLLERDKKKRKAEARHQNTLTSFILLCGGFLLWIFYFGVQKSFNKDIWSLMYYFFSNELIVVGIMSLTFLFFYWRQRKNKHTKEKDKFDDLRKEVIEKMDKYWPNLYGEDVISKVVTQLENQYKINVSYKS